MALVHSYESTGPEGLGRFLLHSVSSFAQQRSGHNSSCPSPPFHQLVETQGVGGGNPDRSTPGAVLLPAA